MSKKLISWNVNGIRACMKKGFLDFVKEEVPDVLCIQETKMQEGQAEVPTQGYHQYWCSAEKKGYSGTAIFTREEPISVAYGIGEEVHDKEGRAITVEFDDYYLINVYVPNSQSELKRLEYRLDWEDSFKKYIKGLEEKKPVIVCGDLNVAHKPIDLKNPKSNEKNPGYSLEERKALTSLLESGFVDSFRYFYPDLESAYSWWSYRFKSRENNAGWRIDYFLVSERIMGRCKDAKILSQVLGSDHCPIQLII
ncbi:MAG: exodeoxyribonuclease III [Anaerovoracaceae bacterium]